MNKFMWKTMGYEVRHENGRMVEVAEFSNAITPENLEKLLNLGYYFYHPVHHVEISSIEDYHKYVKVN